MGETRNPTTRQTTEAAGFDIGLHDLVGGLEDELFIVTSEYRVKFANSILQHRLPKGIESPVGRNCYEVFEARDKPCSSPLWECPLSKVLQSGSLTTLIHPYRDKYVKITMWPLKDSCGSNGAAVELRRDVTAERELEMQILRRHHHLDALSNISRAVSGLWRLDDILNVALNVVLQIFSADVGRILLFDEEAQKLCSKVSIGLSGKYAGEICLAMGEGIAGKVAQTGESILLEDISREPDVARPDLITAEGLKGLVSVPLKAKDRVLGVMNIASHLAGKFATDDMYLLNSIACQLGMAIEQAGLYGRLDAARERYQTLLKKALTMQEEERTRIARELHDETSQELTALALHLQAANEMLEMGSVQDAEIKAIVKKTQSIAVHAGTEVNRLIRELRPTLLDTLGLPAAIRHLAEANLSSQGINVSTEFQGMDQRLPPETELALFRVTQGAMSNIVRHSEATNATISLECNDNQCILRVEDNGKGFDVSEIKGIDSRGRGAGLFGMRERLKLVGGNGIVESQPGQGTKITAWVPITGSEADAEDKSAGSG